MKIVSKNEGFLSTIGFASSVFERADGKMSSNSNILLKDGAARSGNFKTFTNACA